MKKHGLNRALAENCGMIKPDLSYSGTFKHFMPHSNDEAGGSMKWKDGSNYQGAFLNGKRSGKGTYISTLTEECYEGDFKNNRRNGVGYCMFKDGR